MRTKPTHLAALLIVALVVAGCPIPYPERSGSSEEAAAPEEAPVAAAATEDEAPSQVLFESVRVFDGTTDRLSSPTSVLVEDNLIKSVGGAGAGPQAVRIDGGGRTLMPGLIDSHIHINGYKDGTIPDWQDTTWEEIGARAAAMAQEMLAMGFTTVRDMCGAHAGLKKVVDEGLLAGPRFYLAGACLGQTSGHGDWGIAGQRKGESNLERLEITRMVDGRAEMLQGARRNFALGAHYLKLMVSGGVTSIKDPIHGSQFTDDEILAAVEVAEDWDSYVGVHVHQDADISRVLDLGVKVIDHGMTISEESMQKLVEKGAFYSPNLTAISAEAMAHPMHQDPTFPPTVKFHWLVENSAQVFDLVRKYKPKIVFDSDYLLLTGVPYRQSMDFTKFFVAREFGNFWALQMLTSNGGELAELAGKNNPYQDGKLGVIEEGAYADILIVDGNPLEDITVIGANEKWFDAEPREQDVPSIRVIMKDGKIYKNTLDE